MKQSSALLFSSGLSVGTAIFVAASAYVLGDRLEEWRWLFYFGALLTIAAALYPFRQATWGARQWMGGLLRRRRTGSDSNGDSQELPALPNELAALFEERLVEVERRERELADRLAGYHLWFEFPPPVDLADAQPSSPEMLERDRKLEKLLEERTQDLYEKIRKNEYSPEGTFQFTLVREDVYALVAEIATLYGDDPKRPLAGVSGERVLRAAGRCCLKFLVELERLPLDIHSYDLVDIYGYVRRAVNVYGLYRSAQPYMPWLRGAYYGTRFALGANLLALGAWWFVGSVGSKSAGTLTTNIAHRWVLSFLHDIVRVIGFEVASIYDKNLRYRDPNWCFAAELTEFVQFFPASERSLRRALSLIGALQLRNEYDRIFFFRCIVEGKKAGLRRIQAADLPPEQRREIAERLEAFLESNIADPHPKIVQRWRAGVEERLDIALTLDGAVPARPEREQRQDAIRSLAGYLLEIKQVETESLQSSLAAAKLVDDLPAEDASDFWQSLTQNPPFFFQAPESVPDGRVARDFLKDLVSLAVRVPPRYALADEIVVSTAVRLRCDARSIKKRLDAEYADEVARLLPKDAPNRRLDPDVARAVLDLVQEGEELRFVYGNVRPVAADHIESTGRDGGKTWLVGVGNRLVAFTISDIPELVWEGDGQVRVEYIPGRIRNDFRLIGGRWLKEAVASAPVLLLKGSVLIGSKRYFAALQDFCAR